MASDQPAMSVRIAAAAASRRRYPERSRARNRVAYEIASGRMARPEVCARCGAACTPEASHDDYSRPLDVEWLCRPCHVAKDRPSACPAGHIYTPETTAVTPTGRRRCRVCKQVRDRGYYAKRGAK